MTSPKKKTAPKRLRARTLKPGEKLKAGRTRPRRPGSRSRAVPAAPITLASLVDGDTKKRLTRFCEAHHNADPNVVILQAINDFITSDLEDNKGVSDAYNLVR